MDKLLEFNCVIYLKDDRSSAEKERYADMGIIVPNEDNKEEKIVRYAFDVSNIVEIRETFVEYQGEWHEAVCVMYIITDRMMTETPALLITYDEFKRKVNEHNKKNTEAE